jgi:hypothetical protein
MAQTVNEASQASQVSQSIRLAQEHVSRMFSLAKSIESKGGYATLREKLSSSAERGQSALNLLAKRVSSIEQDIRNTATEIERIDSELRKFDQLFLVLQTLRKINKDWTIASASIAST